MLNKLALMWRWGGI